MEAGETGMRDAGGKTPGGEVVAVVGETRLRLVPFDPALADDLLALYACLAQDDLRHRFLSAWHPRAFVEQWLGVGERGGFGLIVVAEERGTECVVAEAGYALLDDGNGELGMTVAPRWRGWLGPYLLDRLVVEARCRDVPGLEAVVLTDNRAMRALAAWRGSVVADRDGLWCVRLLIGTAGPVPEWPRHCPGPRVLAEVPSGWWGGADEARRLGATLLECPGSARMPQCPAVRGRLCPLVAGADVVVAGVGGEQGAALAAAHRGSFPLLALLEPATPAAVVVEVGAGSGARL